MVGSLDDLMSQGWVRADVKAKIERAREDMAAAIEKVKLIDRQAQEENHENNENK